MSVGARHSCDKQQQLTTTWPITMDMIKAITDCDRHNQCHHCEAPKRSRNKPLKCNKEGHGDQPQSHKAALPTNATRVLWGRHEYHSNTHPATTIIVTGASIAVTQAQRTQEGDTLHGKPQADRANSCPRSPTMNAGSITKQQKRTWKQNKKNTRHSRYGTYAMHHTRRSLDKPRTELPGRASDTVPSDDRTSASDNNKTYHFVGNPKITRMLIVWCSGLAIAPSSRVQSAKNISDGFSRWGCLDSKLDAQILLRCLLTSSSKISVWFQ